LAQLEERAGHDLAFLGLDDKVKNTGRTAA
jgi:hypothetical protein